MQREEEIDAEEEELELQRNLESLWTHGIAGLPKEPATDEAKTLIKPNKKE